MTKILEPLFALLPPCIGITAFLFVSCSGSGGVVDQDEDIFPSTVIDLRVKSVTPTTVTLEWTAPGNDSTTGTAEEYDMRWSRTELTWQNWDSASQLTGEPLPSPSGSTDTMLITGLLTDSTYYFALMTRNSYDRWSWMSNCVSAVCFDNFEVVFPDAHLEQVIRSAIALPTGAIHRVDLLPLQLIEANADSIADLSGIEYCINLQTILMSDNLISDLAPLSDLTKLTSLQAGKNHISDIGLLSGLINLQQLILTDNTITDISAMTNMSKLVDINLAGNAITDITPLAGKPSMVMLVLERNLISDISPLSAMVNLINLNLASNDIINIDALSGLTGLTSLSLYDNDVTDITPLAALVNLESLNLWKNDISDVTSLSGLTYLKRLYLIENQIDNIAPLSNLTGLEEIYLSFNPLSDISALSDLTSLTEIQIQSCQVVDITALQGMPDLQKLVLYYNQIVDIGPLAANSGLATGDLLYLTGNPLSDESTNTHLPALVARGVTVYF